MQLLYRRHGSSPVALHSEDACRGRHLEDQVSIMGNGHEPVQSRLANYGVEWEVHFRNLKLNVLYAEIYLYPKCDWQGDGPHWVDGIRAHSGEWARQVKRPPIREDLKVMLYQSQEADNTFITSDGTTPYNSMR
jgi:hypothetical protein